MINETDNEWPDDIARAHWVSSIALFILFGIVSLALLVVSFINGWRVLNKDKALTGRQVIITLFFIGSFISPIFGRFFRSSLDFKYFFALKIENTVKEKNATLVDHKVIVPNTLIMNVFAISVFGTAVTLPIMLIIFKFSTLLEAYHPTITKIRIMLSITLLHILVDIPALICEYFYVDKYITSPPPVFVPMKAILLVIENCFMLISICMVEFRSQTLHNLDIAERVMIMRFALLGIILYLGGNIIRLALMAEQAYLKHPTIDHTCVRLEPSGAFSVAPFSASCLNYAEIVMLTLVSLSVLVALIVLISNLVLYQRFNNYRTFIETAANQTESQNGNENKGETNEDPDAHIEEDNPAPINQ